MIMSYFTLLLGLTHISDVTSTIYDKELLHFVTWTHTQT